MRVMVHRLQVYVFFLLLSGCGIESTIPENLNLPSEPDVQTGDQIVNVSNLDYDIGGVEVSCNINGDLLSPSLAIEVFIEFDGVEIERVSQTNVSQYVFTRFTPAASGELRCVVEYASAEFESSISWIDKSSIP